MLAAALTFVLLDAYVFTDRVDHRPASIQSEDVSIAVLPFVDLSAAKDSEYFSDGIAEQVLDLLSRIPELRVIARTSSFAFKGKDADVATIAQRLNETAEGGISGLNLSAGSSTQPMALQSRLRLTLAGALDACPLQLERTGCAS